MLLDVIAPELPAAEFSVCRTWRYVLRRRWAAGPVLGFLLLNPSTADETENDPTIRRCIAYAKAWGYSGLVLGNLFAFRATKPKDMLYAADPVGPWNDAALHKISAEAEQGRVICGWGAHGGLMGRGPLIVQRLHDWGARPEALILTGSGEPGHPLYLRGDLKPFPLGAPR